MEKKLLTFFISFWKTIFNYTSIYNRNTHWPSIF